jgi:ribonuclease R
MFQLMEELHHILENKRTKRGAINFEDHEARVLVDENGNPQDIVLRSRGVAERIIESFMLSANETVAHHFAEKHFPFMYRIHEHPKAEKLERFIDFVRAFGLDVKGTKEEISPKELQHILGEIEGKPEEVVINTMLLRSMQQAKYSTENYGHYGLASEYYTHFTSPIRRYPDLMVHRLIRSYGEDSSKKRQDKWQQLLPEIADHSSQMERRAVNCEREVDAMKKAEYMEQHIGEEFPGVISSVAKFGLFVELENTIEGFIHVNNLKDDYYQYIDKFMALVGERTGRTFKIGQKVVIRVVKSDRNTREIDFELVETEEVDSLKEYVQKTDKKPSGNRNRRRHEKSNDKKKNTKQKSDNFSGKGKNKKKKTQPFYKKVAKKGKKKKK